MPEPKKSGNQACSEAMRERAYKQHRERLAATKPTVDTSAPESAAYTRHVGKQGSQQKKYDQVERDNQVLVERLVHVMNTKGAVDNSAPWRDHNKAIDSQRRRQKKQDAVDAENQRMLQRLQNAKPTYSSEKLKKDRKNNETYANRISHYPYRPMDRPEPIRDLEAEEGSDPEEEEEDFEGDVQHQQNDQQQQQQAAERPQQTPPQAPPQAMHEEKSEEEEKEGEHDGYSEDDDFDESEDEDHEIGSSEDEKKNKVDEESADDREL